MPGSDWYSQILDRPGIFTNLVLKCSFLKQSLALHENTWKVNLNKVLQCSLCYLALPAAKVSGSHQNTSDYGGTANYAGTAEWAQLDLQSIQHWLLWTPINFLSKLLHIFSWDFILPFRFLFFAPSCYRGWHIVCVSILRHKVNIFVVFLRVVVMTVGGATCWWNIQSKMNDLKMPNLGKCFWLLLGKALSQVPYIFSI